ncbi:outer membrane lipoprotein-sorting protein [Lysinibacillus sp. G4S2]|uniref:LolA family protein n=1 Tax=Lysinibacillus sp. G4S2 TaxID=3055859 RepID=UPI0025A2A2F3|nr:outer membrane lipoprotein-sorting protein [Lysinibacillus sp. G4S2]MDM5247765.1 outer membrane lipoprotein-sorting protein [Lysinibacillus sp. G4S2]
MNWKKSLRAAGLVAALTFSLVGCNTEGSYSPQEIIDHALQETKEPLAYYGEYTMDMGEAGGKAQIKEWTKDGKRRIETTAENGEHSIAVNNGSQVMMYDVVKNTVHKIDISKGGLDEFPSQRDQLEMLFNTIKDTHDVKIAGEEKIAGRDTYKIVAKAKKDDTLIGDIEVWVDKKTWVILKTITNSAGNKMTTEYTKLDDSAKIDDAQFTIDIPKDAKVEDISVPESESVTLDTVKEQLGEFLMVPEENGLTLEGISLDKGIEDRSEYTFNYSKNDQQDISVAVFKANSNATKVEPIFGEKEMDIRGQKGTVMDEKKFRSISWQENGYQYTIFIGDSELTIEDLAAYAKQMTIVK